MSKVLVIDDDQALVTTWSIALEKEGFEVITATSGQEGIDKTKNFHPDIILLDQIMPDRLGNDVLASLKVDQETANIPVLLISNYSENQMMKDAIQQGAVDYVLKYQIETSDLINRVKSILVEKQSSPNLEPSNNPTS